MIRISSNPLIPPSGNILRSNTPKPVVITLNISYIAYQIDVRIDPSSTSTRLGHNQPNRLG